MNQSPSVVATINDLFHKGQITAANALLAEHWDNEQHNPDFLLLAAAVARELRALDSAKTILARLLALAPHNVEAHALAYKVAYDDTNLPAAMQHVALAARLKPANIYMKQLALMLSLPDTTQDHWWRAMVTELTALPLSTRELWRTALILAAAKQYDEAIKFLALAQQRQPNDAEQLVEVAALANDMAAVQQLATGQPTRFPAYDNQAWHAYNAEMQPCPAEATSGPPVTVIVTSHFSNKLVLNAAKAPPNIELLTETLASFRTHAALPADWPIVFCFDAPFTPQPAEEAHYVTALTKLAAANNGTVRLFRGAGLRHVFLDVFKDIRTPYFMMLEHDWLCARAVEPLPALVSMMNEHSFVHHVRFCRHHMHINHTDWYLLPETRVSSMPLTATPTYSNNPSITRTAKFKRDWLPRVLADDTLATANGGAGGLEENIFTASFRHMRRWGAFANRAAEGTYLIGAPNDEPRIIHTGI